jgi:hypothetical protein
MSEIGDMATCDRCFEEEKIFFIAKVKKYNEPEVKTLLCEGCFNDKCYCALCLEETNYSSYEKHLLDKHTHEEMAKQLLYEKASSDRM